MSLSPPPPPQLQNYIIFVHYEYNSKTNPVIHLLSEKCCTISITNSPIKNPRQFFINGSSFASQTAIHSLNPVTVSNSK